MEPLTVKCFPHTTISGKIYGKKMATLYWPILQQKVIRSGTGEHTVLIWQVGGSGGGSLCGTDVRPRRRNTEFGAKPVNRDCSALNGLRALAELGTGLFLRSR